MVEQASHTMFVDAPPDRVYDLVADVSRWPVLFAPTVHVAHLERSNTEELVRIWAFASGSVTSSTSRRTLDPVRRVIRFRQQANQPGVASLGGTWLFHPGLDGGTAVELRHHFEPVADNPRCRDRITHALDVASAVELASLQRAATSGAAGELIRFAESAAVDGPVEAVYRFIDEAGPWSESVRVLLPGSIAYKQTRLPELLTCHIGRWLFAEHAGYTEITSEHAVIVDPDAVEAALGAGSTLADARGHARRALGRDSRATLRLAQAFAAATRRDRQ